MQNLTLEEDLCKIYPWEKIYAKNDPKIVILLVFRIIFLCIEVLHNLIKVKFYRIQF